METKTKKIIAIASATAIIGATTTGIIVGVAQILPLLKNKKLNFDDTNKGYVMTKMPTSAAWSIGNINDEKIKANSDQSKFITGYDREVFKDDFTKDYILQKITDIILKDYPNFYKDKDLLTTKNIKISLDDPDDNGHIVVSVLNYDGEVELANLNFYKYKYAEEYILDELFNKKIRELIDFSKTKNDSIAFINSFMKDKKYLDFLNSKDYKSKTNFIKSYNVERTSNKMSINIEALEGRTYSYSIIDFDSPSSKEIASKITSSVDLSQLENSDKIPSSVSVDNVLTILKSKLSSTDAKNLLEEVKSNFKLTPDDKNGTLNIKFLFHDKEIEWNIGNFLIASEDTSINSVNVDDFIKNKDKYIYADTIEEKAFEGKTIPDGFVFPDTIEQIFFQGFYNTTFEGSFTLPKWISMSDNVFEKATFNADLTLPNALRIVGENTFLNSVWNNAFLTKLPDELDELDGNSLAINENGELIPLANDFTLENTKIREIKDGEYGAFYKYKLPANFKLPDTIEYIGDNAFKDADFSKLKDAKLDIQNYYNITIRNSSGLSDTNISDESKSIQNKEKIKTLVPQFVDRFLANKDDDFFSDLESIGRYTFEGKIIPDGFIFPDNINYFDKRVFYNASFEGSFTLSKEAAFPFGYAFEKATFNGEFTLPENTTSLALGMFKDVTFNDVITLPENIKSIGKDVFEGADFSALLDWKLVIPSYDVVISKDSGIDPNLLEYGTLAKKTSKLTTLSWNFVGLFLSDPTNELFSNIEKIGEKVFDGKTIPDGFVFPDTIKEISSLGFYNTTFEGSFTLPNNIKLGYRAFNNATFKKTFTLPEGITMPNNEEWNNDRSERVMLSDNMFVGATFNADLTLPDSLQNIGENTFLNSVWNNAFLTKLPDELDELDGNSLAINENGELIPLADDFTLENTKIREIKDGEYGAFYKYKLPANFKLPDTLLHIGKNAFKDVDFSALGDRKLVVDDTQRPKYYFSHWFQTQPWTVSHESGLNSSNLIFKSSLSLLNDDTPQEGKALFMPPIIPHKDDDIKDIY